MGISCTKLRFFGKKRVFLVHCDVCCSLCNVVDIVNLVNYIFGMGDFTDEQLCAADLNGDGIINVLDIVNLVNAILSL